MLRKKPAQSIRALCCGVLVHALTVLLPVVARADGINGFMEYNWSSSDSTMKDSGAETTSRSSSLLQRYNLSLDRTLFPNLRFMGGGNVELNKTETESRTSDLTTSLTSKSTKMLPYANLSLNSGFTTAGVGFSRRQEKTETMGAPAMTNINDNYNIQLGLKPEGLPTVDLFASRFNSYDGDHQFLDTVNDSLLLNVKYSLLKKVDLSYQWLYNDLQDKRNSLEIRSITNSARVSYADQFFNNRVSFFSSYNISNQATESIASGNGDILNQQFPVHGYFKISQFPDTPASGNLDQYDQLIAGNGTVNIGAPPFGVSDTKPRNIAIEFGTDTTVNTLRVLVNQNLVDQNFYARFSWDVYTSADQGKTWQLVQTVSPQDVTFGFFVGSGGTAGYGFELRIPRTTSRFLKVVTTPLQLTTAAPQGVDAGTILVTKLEAYNRGAAPAGIRTTSNLSGHYDMSTRVKLLEAPSLYYDLNFTFDHSRSDMASAQRWNVTNSLSLAHSFTPHYSVAARVSREDAADGGGNRAANVYSASFTATPLPALTHSVVFSGRNETVSGQSTSSYSLFLNNTAELYRGFNVSFNGGASRSYSTQQRRSDDLLFLFGASLIPHPMLNINLSATGRKEWQTGASQPDSTDYKQDNEISVTLNPVKSIYLFGAVGITMETGKDTVMTRNFGGSWAPFRDGNLLLNIAYNESGSSDQGSQQTRSLVQSLRWYFRRASYLDVSYLMSNSSSISQNTDTNTVSAALKFTF